MSADKPAKAIAEEAAVSPEVVYSIDSIKSDGDQLFFIMLRGRRGRMAARRVKEAGIRVVMPVTSDHRLDSSASEADETVVLGANYSSALYSNAYAVLTAAETAQATALILGDEALPLAEVDSFLWQAHRKGISVFRPFEAQGAVLGLVKCEARGPDRGEPLWRQCQQCHLYFDERSLAKQSYTCPNCGTLMRLNSNQRINDLLDLGSFEEWDVVLDRPDPLQFAGYREKLDLQEKRTGLTEAVRTGFARLSGLPLAIGIMDSTFLMGSMGSVVGEKLARLFDRATDKGLSVVVLCASGGARMQEGIISLMQMAKVSCAVERHSAAGLVYISVLTDPTTGGVTASFAMQGDIVLAEPGALVGFAGKRVVRDTIRQELPEGFQTAEFALEHGLIDAIVRRQDLRATLSQLIAFHIADTWNGESGEGGRRSRRERFKVRGPATYNSVFYGAGSLDDKEAGEQTTPENPVTAWVRRFMSQGERGFERRMRRAAQRSGIDQWEGPLSQEDATEETRRSAEEAWEHVQLARNVHRPTSRFYLDKLTDGFIELHGDRAYGDDAAIVCGIAWLKDRPITVITQEKGSDVQERILRNFGCPQPEGYRKSLRLMKQAEKFDRPILCIVDTQGAFCGIEAEERGQGNAIAENLKAMAGLTVPVVSVLVGEGGSGGALALALANRVAMQEHAVYSVLSPEGFASILWKDRSRAPEAAAAMKMSAADALSLGVVDCVLPEGRGPAHENPDEAADALRRYVESAFDELDMLSGDELVEQRQERFARF